MATAMASQASSDSISVFEPQQRMHHQLHLMLLRAAIADHAGLDLERRVLAQWKPASAIASRTTPRACDSFSAVFTFCA